MKNNIKSYILVHPLTAILFGFVLGILNLRYSYIIVVNSKDFEKNELITKSD